MCIVYEWDPFVRLWKAFEILQKNIQQCWTSSLLFNRMISYWKNEIIFTKIHKTKIYSIKQNIQNSKFSEVFLIFWTTQNKIVLRKQDYESRDSNSIQLKNKI